MVKNKTTVLKSKKALKIKIKKYSIEKILNFYNKQKIVEFKNVDVKFGHRKNVIHAVKNLNLNVYKGEVLGIVGESGSGKSTTGNAILGLVDRANGEVIIKGKTIPSKTKNIKGKINDFLVKYVQMIFQDPASSLNPYKNIYKIVSEGLKNVDVKKIFAKTFDGITVSTLSKILKNKKQPRSLEKISIKWINEKIENDNFDEVIDVLYNHAINDLFKMKVEYSQLAATYLEERKAIREEFTSSSKRKKIEERLVIDIIESVGLSSDILSRFPLEFSGGQQQRIGISRAVVLKPELIVADEPISALDVSIQAQVVNIFNDLKERLNLTIVFIAHDLRMVEYISDRIVVMYKGQVVEIGESNEIFKNPTHPYTISLLNSIPTIDSIRKNLRSTSYNADMHNYIDEKPGWFSISGDDKKQHFVFGTKKEIVQWGGGKYE